MADKSADLAENLGSILEQIKKSNGFFNDVVAVDFGITNYDSNSFSSDQYPRINIIFNNIGIPEFTTTAAKVTVEVKIDAYLRKKNDTESGLESYKESLHWGYDLRKGISNWLKQIPEEIDGDLIDNQIGQTIGFPMNLLTCSTEFGIIFEECY